MKLVKFKKNRHSPFQGFSCSLIILMTHLRAFVARLSAADPSCNLLTCGSNWLQDLLDFGFVSTLLQFKIPLLKVFELFVMPAKKPEGTEV